MAEQAQAAVTEAAVAQAVAQAVAEQPVHHHRIHWKALAWIVGLIILAPVVVAFGQLVYHMTQDATDVIRKYFGGAADAINALEDKCKAGSVWSCVLLWGSGLAVALTVLFVKVFPGGWAWTSKLKTKVLGTGDGDLAGLAAKTGQNEQEMKRKLCKKSRELYEEALKEWGGLPVNKGRNASRIFDDCLRQMAIADVMLNEKKNAARGGEEEDAEKEEFNKDRQNRLDELDRFKDSLASDDDRKYIDDRTDRYFPSWDK